MHGYANLEMAYTVMLAIYISPNPKLDKVEQFFHRTLIECTEEGSKVLGTKGNKFPLIFAGDFTSTSIDRSNYIILYHKFIYLQ